MKTKDSNQERLFALTTAQHSPLYYCSQCGEELEEGRGVWLELNNKTGSWHKNEGEVPEEESQGWFLFGSICAKKVRKNT